VNSCVRGFCVYHDILTPFAKKYWHVYKKVGIRTSDMQLPLNKTGGTVASYSGTRVEKFIRCVLVVSAAYGDYSLCKLTGNHANVTNATLPTDRFVLHSL